MRGAAPPSLRIDTYPLPERRNHRNRKRPQMPAGAIGKAEHNILTRAGAGVMLTPA